MRFYIHGICIYICISMFTNRYLPAPLFLEIVITGPAGPVYPPEYQLGTPEKNYSNFGVPKKIFLNSNYDYEYLLFGPTVYMATSISNLYIYNTAFYNKLGNHHPLN